MTNRQWFELCIRELFDAAEGVSVAGDANTNPVLHETGEWLRKPYQPGVSAGFQALVGPDCPDYVFGSVVGQFIGNQQSMVARAATVGIVASTTHNLLKAVSLDVAPGN